MQHSPDGRESRVDDVQARGAMNRGRADRQAVDDRSTRSINQGTRREVCFSANIWEAKGSSLRS